MGKTSELLLWGSLLCPKLQGTCLGIPKLYEEILTHTFEVDVSQSGYILTQQKIILHLYPLDPSTFGSSGSRSLIINILKSSGI